MAVLAKEPDRGTAASARREPKRWHQYLNLLQMSISGDRSKVKVWKSPLSIPYCKAAECSRNLTRPCWSKEICDVWRSRAWRAPTRPLSANPKAQFNKVAAQKKTKIAKRPSSIALKPLAANVHLVCIIRHR